MLYNAVHKIVRAGGGVEIRRKNIIILMNANKDLKNGKLEIGLTKLGIRYLVKERTGQKGTEMHSGVKTRLVEFGPQKTSTVT